MLTKSTSVSGPRRGMFMLLLALSSLLLLLQPSPSQATVIYVSPTPPTACPGKPCHNLSYYANHSTEYLKSNTTMMFLPGEHKFTVQISVRNAKNFSMIGDPHYMTTVVCKGSECGGFLFMNISRVIIQSLTFVSDTHSVIAALIPDMHVTNCTFEKNSATAFHAMNCTLTLEGCNFTNNFDQGQPQEFLSPGAGIVMLNGTMILTGQNYFFNNTCLSDHCGGSAIYAQYSQVTVKGNTTLVKNSVNNTLDSGNNPPSGGGGALFLTASVDIVGQMSFIDNTVHNTYLQKNKCEINGGGASLVDSNISISGQVFFLNNSAEGISGCGGALYLRHGGLTISGKVELVNNSAGYFGGAIITDGINIFITGNMSLTGNSGEYSGGLAIHESTMNVTKIGSIEFYNNTASYDGGGIEAEDSTINVNGTLTIAGNMALYGGGIVMLRSSLDIHGLMSVNNNHAVTKVCQTDGHGQGGGINMHENTTLNVSGEALFLNNTACIAGAILTDGSSVTVDGNISISNNMATLEVGGILVAAGSSAVLRNGLISNNRAYAVGGMYLGASKVLITEKVVIRNNIAEYFGGGVAVLDNSHLNVTGTLEVIDNIAVDSGGGIIAQQSEITIAGHALVANNSVGSNGGSDGGGLQLRIQTVLTVLGTMSIINNTADHSGGGIFMEESRLLIAGKINFTGNHAALLGGAIAVKDTTSLVYCTSHIEGAECIKEECFFKNISTSSNSPLMVFEGNTARTGTVLFGGSLDNCRVDNQPDADSSKVFDAIADYSKQPHTNSLISSLPYKVCLCENNEPRCGKEYLNITVYPGETFSFQAVAVGQRNGTVFQQVINAVTNLFPRGSSRIGVFEERQIVSDCTQLNYTMFANTNSGLQLYVYGSCSSLLGSENRLQLPVVIKLPCPPAFTLSAEPYRCICEERLQKYTNSCDINGQNILRDGDFWVGYDNISNITGLILHPHCPFDYCTSKPVNFTLNDINKQCRNNRTGLLCGSCGPGLSLAIGSTNCLPCSNDHLTLLVPFAAMGVVFVIFFLVFHKVFTVKAGMIGGLIFYASIVGANQKIFFPAGKKNIIGFAVMWFKLDLGIETCFYDGMDIYAKTWLQLLFPFYLFSLITLLIIIRKFFPSVADKLRIPEGKPLWSVLATFFILSFGKIVSTVIVALSYTTLEYPDRQELVWLYDANIKYLHGKHIPLFAVSLVLATVLIIPFTLFLLFGQWLRKWKKLEPILDIYHNPFDKNHRYWPGLLLVVRLALFVIFGANALTDYSENLLVISAATFGLLAWPWISGGQVYKYDKYGEINEDFRFFGVLESSYMLNLGVFAVATFYVRQSGGNQAAVAYTSTGVALATFVMTILYHFYRQRKEIKEILCRIYYRRIRSLCKKCWRKVDGESQSFLIASDSSHQIVM